MRYTFECDYNEGMAPEILEALSRTNMVQVAGYGMDPYTEAAKEKIRVACASPEAQITLLSGGTQTNQLIIDTMLAPYEGVVAADTGHVAVHEAGAVEFTGHKVLTVPSHDGKMDAGELEAFVSAFYGDGNHEHMVYPGMVYISHPTEMGTLYTRSELTAIAAVCHEYGMPLYLDGARLGYGIAAMPEVDLPFIAKTVDVFYIGGTKVGALFGEAVVFTKGNEPAHFVTQVKQHGALLAKGRALGVQFDTLFTDELYLRLGRHAIDMAGRLQQVLADAGFAFYMESKTNQQFVIIENSKMEPLAEKVGYGFWEAYDADHTVIRFCTSWATTAESLAALAAALKEE